MSAAWATTELCITIRPYLEAHWDWLLVIYYTECLSGKQNSGRVDLREWHWMNVEWTMEGASLLIRVTIMSLWCNGREESLLMKEVAMNYRLCHYDVIGVRVCAVDKKGPVEGCGISRACWGFPQFAVYSDMEPAAMVKIWEHLMVIFAILYTVGLIFVGPTFVLILRTILSDKSCNCDY